ncbi:hypothetical protein FYA86_00975 [Bordetella holmesii]|nr:hypothetical protein FYA86_00975 [Bordetella holmesii]
MRWRSCRVRPQARVINEFFAARDTDSGRVSVPRIDQDVSVGQPRMRQDRARCEDSIGCMHGSSEPDLRNWKSPTPSSLKEP